VIGIVDGNGLKNLLDATFRTNPDYELVLFDRLQRSEQDRLAELLTDPELYGVLRPRVPGLNIKSVTRDVALLLYSLAAPGPLPRYAQAMLGAQSNRTIAQLILDDVLQIQSGSEFICGPRARSVIDGSETDGLVGADVLGRLSLDALRYAQALQIDDVTALARRLYSYNRLPASAHWKQRLPSRTAVAEFLDVETLNTRLRRQWIKISGGHGDPWLFWASRTAGQQSGRNHKLYISPHPAHLKDTLATLAGILGATRARAFKIGAHLNGILRPDKLVIYFGEHDDMRAAADRLGQALAGMPAQGVPFTAIIDRAGLLSWGVDPPREDRLLPWQGPSWRGWIADVLAVALNAARREPTLSTEPWQFALRKLQLRGVDPATWIPRPDLWAAQ
jgi:hypothetical protein